MTLINKKNLQTIIFASNNENKAKEIRSLLPDGFFLKTLKEANILIEIEEPYDTLQANAKEKARVINEQTQGDCFSEDSGLEVEALGGEPGVRSARYAGEEGDNEANINLLLINMQLCDKREARFRTVICFHHAGTYYFFEGECPGKIIHERKGTSGFGYDPIFVPDGADKTFAEMDMQEKNIYSHRKKATAKFIAFLNEKYAKDQN